MTWDCLSARSAFVVPVVRVGTTACPASSSSSAPKFPRLRFGIGSDFARGRQSEYVLGTWAREEQESLEERIELAGKAVLQFGMLGIAQAMNGFNKR